VRCDLMRDTMTIEIDNLEAIDAATNKIFRRLAERCFNVLLMDPGKVVEMLEQAAANYC